MSAVSPVGTGLKLGRTDQGVDWSGSGPLYAVGAGTIINLYNNGWPGGTFIALKLDQAAGLPSDTVYYAEDIAPAVSIGQHVNAGDVIGHATGGSSGIELGWADPNAIGAALARSQFTGANATQLGQAFKDWIGGGVANLTAATGQSPDQIFSDAGPLAAGVGLSTNEIVAYSFFIAKGLSPAAAAGIVGNLMQESGVNPETNSLDGQHKGIAQWDAGRWSAGGGSSLQTGNVHADMMAQLNLIWSELNGPYASTLGQLQSTGSASQAAQAFNDGFERSGDSGQALQNRLNNANTVFMKAKMLPAGTATGSIGSIISDILGYLAGSTYGGGAQGAQSGLGGIPGLSGLEAIGSFFSSLGGFVSDLTSPYFWERIGIFLLGAGLLIGGTVLFMSQTKEGQRVVSEAEQGAAVAAMA